MRVLVTGATGFLGSHVLAVLTERGAEVRALVRPGRAPALARSDHVEAFEGDLLDEASLVHACQGVDALVHCAARTGYWSRQNELQRRVNVEGSSALYRAAHKARIARIVHVSSVATIGATRDGSVLDERALWNLRGLRIQYVNTKREAEERALAAARAGMPIVVVNPSMLLGPRLDGRQGSSLVARVAEGRARWSPPGGASVTDVEDVAIAIAGALERGSPGERYVLAGHNLEWRALQEAIARAAGVELRARRMPLALVRALALGARALDLARLSRPHWAPELFRSYGWYSWLDSSKAWRELGYRVRPLEEILQRSLPRRARAE